VAVIIGVIAVTTYVIISGIHGSAWTSVVKDTMVLAVIVFLGLYLPFALYGGIEDMFQQINAEKPGFLALPSEGLSVPWFISTVLLTALGFYMWPHTFGSSFSAQNARVFKRNAIFMPLYQLILLFAFFVGFAAILQVPGLEGPEADLSLLRVSLQQFDPWLVGLIGAAGLLTALVPGSMLLMVSATVLSKNVYRAFRPGVSEEQVTRLAKFLVPVVALAAMAFTFWTGLDLVLLLLLGYSLVTQLFPALLFSFLPNNFVTKWGAAAGVFTGVAVVSYLTIFEVKLRAVFPALGSLGDTNVGIVAMLANVVVLVVVSLATRPSTVAKEQRA
jgi:solute:Na+ symporter, SSS family